MKMDSMTSFGETTAISSKVLIFFITHLNYSYLFYFFITGPDTAGRYVELHRVT